MAVSAADTASLLIVAILGLGLTLAIAFTDDRRGRTEADRRLTTIASAAETQLDVWLGVHERAVEALAAAIGAGGDFAPAALTQRLVEVRASSIGFLTLLATDSTGAIVAVAPERRADGSSALLPRRSAADRDYFREPRRTGRAYRSGVFQGRGFGTDPIVAISAPLVDAEGRFRGVVEGSLSLDALRRLVRSYVAGDGIVLADDRGVVITASPSLPYRPLDTLATGPSGAVGGVESARRAADGVDVLVLERRDRRGWSIRVEGRLDELRAAQRAWHWRLAVAVALVVLLVLLVAIRVVRGVTAPLERLTRDLRTDDLVAVEALADATSFREATAEVQALLSVLREQQARVTTANALLRTALDEREAVIADRTHDLQALAFDLAEEKDRAERANRAKSEFLARMSHELRTPLNSVIGFTQQVLKLRGADLSPRERLMLERALANGQHLLALINDILDLARIEAGKVEFERAPVDTGALVQEVVAALEGQPRPPAVTLRAVVPAGVPPVELDGARLRQVLINLVGNALKFTRTGGVTAELEVDAAGRAVAIAVHDTGIGIPPDRLEAIFQAFEQGDAFTTRQYGGTGLGLAICRQLCDGMGASLTVESRPGAGSVFRVVFGAAGAQRGAAAA